MVIHLISCTNTITKQLPVVQEAIIRKLNTFSHFSDAFKKACCLLAETLGIKERDKMEGFQRSGCYFDGSSWECERAKDE